MILFIGGPVDWEGGPVDWRHGRHGWGTLDTVGEVDKIDWGMLRELRL